MPQKLAPAEANTAVKQSHSRYRAAETEVAERSPGTGQQNGSEGTADSLSKPLN